MEDSELAAAAARGDQEAFASLFVRHREFVYCVAYRILLHEDDALDVTQGVFVKLAGNIGEFSARGSFRGWLSVVTTNAALSHLRKPHRREVASDAHEFPEQAGRTPGPLEIAEHRERRELVGQALEGLSPQQRAIIRMQCCDDIGPAEIAGKLDLPAAHVRVQLRRAIVKLREIILAAPGKRR